MRLISALPPLFLGLAIAAAVEAQTGARVSGEVRDEDGQPMAEVRITITTPAVSTFQIETATNEKGLFGFSLIDATHTYHWRFEKAGYKTVEESLKVGVGQNERRNVRMLSLDAALVAGELEVAPAVVAFNAGAEAYSRGDSEAARVRFEEALAADPELAVAHAALARLHLEAGRFAEAAAAAERALANDPDHAVALRVAVVAYDRLGDAAKLEAARTALAAIDPRAAAAALYAEGVRLFDQEKTAEAIAALEQALAVDPEHARSHYVLGVCYSGLGDSPRAREHLLTFLRLAPDDEDAELAREMLDYL